MDKIGFNSIKRVSLQTFLRKCGNLSDNFVKKRIQIEIRQQEKHYENLSALLVYCISVWNDVLWGTISRFLKKAVEDNFNFVMSGKKDFGLPNMFQNSIHWDVFVANFSKKVEISPFDMIFLSNNSTFLTCILDSIQTLSKTIDFLKCNWNYQNSSAVIFCVFESFSLELFWAQILTKNPDFLKFHKSLSVIWNTSWEFPCHRFCPFTSAVTEKGWKDINKNRWIYHWIRA